MSILQNESTRDPVVVIVGITEPALYDTITFDRQTVDMNGATVAFFMRLLTSRSLVIDGGAAQGIVPPDEDGHNVRYLWRIEDVAIEGEYRGWWSYETANTPLAETPEFPIIITDHGPGFGASTGAVVDGITAYMPVTVQALRRHPNFGDRFLQRHADYVKRITLNEVVPPDLEALYDPLLAEYLSKRTALRLILPAKDFWARQHRTVSTQGPAEIASYPDMLAALDQLALRLKHELASDWRQLNLLVPGLPQLHVEPMPATSLGPASDPRNQPRTPNPQNNPPARTGGPFWGTWMP